MKAKPYWEMNPQELAEATRDFDEPFVADQSRPLNPAERDKWSRAKRKRGRPKVDQGFKRVSVSLEQGLLTRVTALAKKRRISRSALVAKALEQVLAREGRPVGGEGKRAV
jgi:Ribbon-helix-helix protein, copG family